MLVTAGGQSELSAYRTVCIVPMTACSLLYIQLQRCMTVGDESRCMRVEWVTVWGIANIARKQHRLCAIADTFLRRLRCASPSQQQHHIIPVFHTIPRTVTTCSK